MSPSHIHEGDFPGRVAICEWCGFFVQNLQATGDLTFCPRCHNQSLIEHCSSCKAPICVPPQQYCLGCGKRLTVLEVRETPMGPQHVAIIEPDAEQRKELESKGFHWHDVVTGQAPGGPPNTLPTPPGWTKEEWDKAVARTRELEGLPPRENEVKKFPPGIIMPPKITRLEDDFYGRPIRPRRNALTEAMGRLLYNMKMQKALRCPKCGLLYLPFEGTPDCPHCRGNPEPLGA